MWMSPTILNQYFTYFFLINWKFNPNWCLFLFISSPCSESPFDFVKINMSVIECCYLRVIWSRSFDHGVLLMVARPYSHTGIRQYWKRPLSTVSWNFVRRRRGATCHARVLSLEMIAENWWKPRPDSGNRISKQLGVHFTFIVLGL